MFFVPAYQRGRDRRYYLPPVVVKGQGDEWELVDGQLRLTTLYLL